MAAYGKLQSEIQLPLLTGKGSPPATNSYQLLFLKWNAECVALVG